MPVQAPSGIGSQKKEVKPVKSRKAAADNKAAMDMMSIAVGWKAPPRRF